MDFLSFMLSPRIVSDVTAWLGLEAVDLARLSSGLKFLAPEL